MPGYAFASIVRSRVLPICAISGLFLLVGATAQTATGQVAPLSPERAFHNGEDGPPCVYDYSVPYHNTSTTCVEVLYDTIAAPEAVPNLTGLALDDNDTLYFARTTLGEIWMMPDYDGDGFPEQARRIAADLELPTALDWHTDALYILTHSGVIRLGGPGTPQQSQVTLISGDSQWASAWPSSIGVGPDERLYISLSDGCAYCQVTDSAQGRLISYALDGSDARLEVSGLSQPLDFAWHPQTGKLWLSSGAPLDLMNEAPDTSRPPDHLLAVSGPPNSPIIASQFAFPPQSTPTGLAFYPYDEFSFWQGDLIVVERGSWSLPEPAGYALMVIDFDAQGQPTPTINAIAPTSDPDSVYAAYSISQHSLTDQGFFPHHPHDVVVSSHGWIYVSVEEGRILRFRPRPADSAAQ